MGPGPLVEQTHRFQSRRLYVDGPFGQIHLRVAYPETPLYRPMICFHMSPVSSQMFETWITEIGRDRVVIAIDTPGFGCSDVPDAPPTMADYAKAMGDVLDAPELNDFDLTTVDLLGYHTGGRIAVQLTLQRPEAITHIILVGAGMYSPTDQKKHYESFSRDETQEDGSHLTAVWNSMLRWRGPHRTLNDLMKTYPDMIRGKENQHLMYGANTEFSLADHLKDIGQPILVLNPRDDLWAYTALIEPFLKESDRLITLPGWGIGFLDYHTVEAAEMVRAFVDGTVRRHSNWNNQRPDLKEDLAHLVQDIKRRICGIASAGSPWFCV